jgi:hypothetical protein
MELRDDLRVVEDDLGNERARLDVASPLELEEVALGADDRPLRETLEEAGAHARIMSVLTGQARGRSPDRQGSSSLRP